MNISEGERSNQPLKQPKFGLVCTAMDKRAALLVEVVSQAIPSYSQRMYCITGTQVMQYIWCCESEGLACETVVEVCGIVIH